MKKLILIPLILAGCTKEPSKPDPFKAIGCNIAVGIGNGLSAQIAQELQCQNIGAIQSSVYDGLVKIKVCEKKPMAMSALSVETANPLCLMAGNILLEAVVSNAIPAEWGCTGGNAKDKLMDAVNKACSKIK